jgi:hypothetical protein
MPSLHSFASLLATTALLKLANAASECDTACILATGLISCGDGFDCVNNVRRAWGYSGRKFRGELAYLSYLASFYRVCHGSSDS